MDWGNLRQVLPHYVVLVLILLLVLSVLRSFVPDLNIWIQLAVAVIVGIVYPQLIRMLGLAPDAWK